MSEEEDLVQTPSPQAESLSGHQNDLDRGLPRQLTIHLCARDDGGLQVFSDDVPDFYISGRSEADVLADIGPVLSRILWDNYGKFVSEFCNRGAKVTAPSPQHPFEPSLNAPTLPVDGSKSPEAIIPHPQGSKPCQRPLNPSERRSMRSDDKHDLRYIAETVVGQRRKLGDLFPENIVEMMIGEAREAIKQAMSDTINREARR